MYRDFERIRVINEQERPGLLGEPVKIPVSEVELYAKVKYLKSEFVPGGSMKARSNIAFEVFNAPDLEIHNGCRIEFRDRSLRAYDIQYSSRSKTIFAYSE